jgi:hypothetical protein
MPSGTRGQLDPPLETVERVAKRMGGIRRNLFGAL